MCSNVTLGGLQELKQLAATFLGNYYNPAMFVCRHHPQFMERLPLIGRFLLHTKRSCDRLTSFFDSRIAEHAADLAKEHIDDMRPTDVVGAFLMERARLERDGDTDTLQYFSMLQLRHLCFDIWLAGQVR